MTKKLLEVPVEGHLHHHQDNRQEHQIPYIADSLQHFLILYLKAKLKVLRLLLKKVEQKEPLLITMLH